MVRLHFLRGLLLCGLAGLSCVAPAHADDEAGIRAVIDAFGSAIVDKDRARFVALFVDDGVAWRSVMGDAMLARVRQREPRTAKVDRAGSPAAFIDGIASDASRSEEVFDRIRIDSDGDLASVVFDYRFLDDGRETNRGKEAWHLLRTEQGWRIVSVVWSMRDPPQAKASP